MKKHGFNVIGVVIAVAAVAFIGLATWLVIDGINKSTNFDEYDFNAVISGDEHNGNISDHLKKDQDGTFAGEPIYIFEYADFQCSACAALYSRVNQAIDELDGKLIVVYRNYLLDYHQNATAAASAAEAAGLQGYWEEYSKLLFNNQSEWAYKTGSARTALFEKYFLEATGGQGDIEKFREDLASSHVSKKISFDMGIGKRINVGGTPAFYIDGQFIDWADSDKNGTGSVEINGETINWEGSKTNSEFVELIKTIVNTKLEQK